MNEKWEGERERVKGKVREKGPIVGTSKLCSTAGQMLGINYGGYKKNGLLKLSIED